MITKLPNSAKTKSKIDDFLPALLSFGPFLMVIGLHGPVNSHAWSGFAVAVIGCVMLSIGLTLLFAKQVRMEHRLDELERLKIRDAR